MAIVPQQQMIAMMSGQQTSTIAMTMIAMTQPFTATSEELILIGPIGVGVIGPIGPASELARFVTVTPVTGKVRPFFLIPALKDSRKPSVLLLDRKMFKFATTTPARKPLLFGIPVLILKSTSRALARRTVTIFVICTCSALIGGTPFAMVLLNSFRTGVVNCLSVTPESWIVTVMVAFSELAGAGAGVEALA